MGLTLEEIKKQAAEAAKESFAAEAEAKSPEEAIAAKKQIFEEKLKDAPHNTDKKKSHEVIGGFLKGLATGDQAVLKDLGTASDGGGYLVPLEFSSTLIELMYKLPVLRARATVLPMSSESMQVPVETATVNANWTAELATITQSDPAFGEVILNAQNLIGISRMSRQILADSAISQNLTDWIMKRFAASIARAEDTAFMVGSGSGQPKGLRQYAGTMAHTIAQAGARLSGDDLINLYHALPYQYRAMGNPVWIINDATLAVIRRLKDSTGRYLYEEGYGQVLTTEGTTPTLLGKPVLVQNDLPTNLGAGTNASEIYFGDMSYYLIGDREQIFSEVSTQEGTSFAQHRAAVKVGERVDGQLSATDAFAVLTGVIA
jgi:HK97 family phage major capsid protein